MMTRRRRSENAGKVDVSGGIDWMRVEGKEEEEVAGLQKSSPSLVVWGILVSRNGFTL